MISMSGTHDHLLVMLSVAVAIFASFTALSLASRIRASHGRVRNFWLAAAAVSLGGGIWSMHFVAMLAFSMPGMAITYDLLPTFVSLGLAIAFTGAGLAVFDWQRVSPRRIVISGLLIATGVVAMHYLGMAAMRMPAALSYDWRWVAISVSVALVAAIVAMWLASRDQRIGRRWLAAIVMGAAISGMHYSGMYAADFVMASHIDEARGAVWRADEIAFLEEMAERIRLVIERVAVEEQLRELNATLETRFETRTRELQEAEAARRDVDALYRAYFENTPDPLFVVGAEPDGSFVVEQINPAHEKGVGFKLEDIRGKRVDEFLPPDVATRVIESYWHTVDTGEIHRYREIFMLNGEPQHWDTTLVPLRDPTGRVVKVLGSSRNVTAQVVAEEALRQSQKMEAMGQLTGGVAHDFNNLLTPIMGALDRLHHKGLGEERDRRLIAGALQSAERARTLVQRLLSFARRQPLQPVPTDVAELAGGMIELISSTIGAQIHVQFDAEPGLPAALVDPNQLEMALLNLSVNARDAMPGGGTLRICVTRASVEPGASGDLPAGDYVRLCVADAGIGMDEETRRRAVEPFFSTKGVGRGTGLGLSMAHGLAAQLGGGLTIDSAPGQGTEICLWLPATALPLRTTADVKPAEAVLGGAKVLLVDDEDAVRESAAQMLIDLGYTVTAVTSAPAALSRIEQGLAADLLITDHVMPGMTGTELAHAVRLLVPSMRILIISGYAEETGIDPELPRLTKPFLQADLAAALAELA